MTDYCRAVISMIGPPENRYSDLAAWHRLEADLGLVLPADYKEIVDAYAPIQINGHLYLSHPATRRWNLGEWIQDTARAFNEVGRDALDLDGDEVPGELAGLTEPVFRVPEGLMPLTSTDRGEYLFLLPGHEEREARLITYDGDGYWSAHKMSFAEWLYRYLVGEDMAGPNSSAFYPGPVQLEDLPMSADERTQVRHGPPRGI
ncbi:SMI1/KNR4 family protein [Streptomyces sp. NPDC052042]|uniref:SMI1/KNR4 family protein n=1 Tax=Streptomyces sp. NPDC052042 TaxID=3365683 RepID=UPI0037D89521